MENLDVYGVCNPLIDLLSHVPDSFLTERGLNKNSMNLITLEEQQTFLMALAAGENIGRICCWRFWCKYNDRHSSTGRTNSF